MEDKLLINDIHKFFDVDKYNDMFSFTLNDWLLQICYRLETQFLIKMDKNKQKKDFQYKPSLCILNTIHSFY